MTVNLHARDDFKKGDVGYATGHLVRKTIASDSPIVSNVVAALQDVKAGTNGWFEDERT